MSSLDNVINELREVYTVGGYKPFRFTLTIDEADNKRIEVLTEALSMSKQDLINRLLMAAVSDLEDTLEESNKVNKLISWLDDEEKEEKGDQTK